MAVTILQRPEGRILGVTEYTALTSDYSGTVVFNLFSHGRTTGDYIYVVSDVDNYNGFFYVEVANPSQFRIRDYPLADPTSFVSVVTLSYYLSLETHGVSAVHLPITYRLSNDKYPVNSVDTARTITSLTNYSGFAQVSLSGSLGTFEDLSFVKISNAPDSDIDGVYQIIDKLSTSSVILNIDYTTVSNASLVGATIQLYYGNYNIVVRVYAGISSSHEWAAQKPYELAATLELIPDEDNQVFFSINDILKAYITLRNNTTLGTLPNNIDFWTNFYISTAEQYDTSNGYSITTLESSFTSDLSSFEGTAINAKLDFKNRHSGYMSDYLMTNTFLFTTPTAKFLTLFTIPVLFSCGADTPDCYSDISLIIPNRTISIVSALRKQFYSNGVLGSTVEDTVNEEEGVIRLELEADCDYDRVDISLLGGLQMINEPEFNATGQWLQTVTAAKNWAISGGVASVVIPPITQSEALYQLQSGTSGNYRLMVSVSTSNETGPDWQADVYVDFKTGGIAGSTVKSQLIGTVSGASVANVLTLDYDATISVPGSFDTVLLFVAGYAGPVFTVTVNVEDIFLAATNQVLSETKEFKIDCGCSNQEIRLTWLNNLAGFEPPWAFTGETDHTIDITGAGETKKNIFPEWPKSYGEFADTIRKQTFRESAKREFVFSQFLTQDEADAIAYIKSSPLVQIINSRTDRRTVIVDTDSFSKYKDGDKTYTISFNILYTDDIPSQRV